MCCRVPLAVMEKRGADLPSPLDNQSQARRRSTVSRHWKRAAATTGREEGNSEVRLSGSKQKNTLHEIESALDTPGEKDE